MRKLIFSGALSVVLSVFLFSEVIVTAQSTFDLEPQLQANPRSSEFTMSPDPDALPIFMFATAQVDDDANIVIATKHAKQELVAPMVAQVDPKLDPKGIRYTENVKQNYTVMVPYSETDKEGNVVTKTRTETRTRTVPVTRYRPRTDDEQAEFEESVAEREAKLKSGEIKAPEVEPAVSSTVTQQYQVQVPYTVVEDGKRVTRTRAETRTRTVNVLRGKTKTKTSVTLKKYPLEEVQCFSVDGTVLDEASIKKRLSERKPVVMLNSEKAVSFEYFGHLLNPEAIFVVIKD